MKPYIPFLFIAAGFANFVGAASFALGYHYGIVGNHFPEVFGPFGLGAIVLWGMAYIAVSTEHPRAPRLLFVFFVEKMVYVGTALYFWFVMKTDFMTLWNEGIFNALLWAGYGLIDLSFGLLFLYTWLQNRK